MSQSQNTFIQVQRLAEATCGLLQGQYCVQSVGTNKKYENFQNIVGNLGTTILVRQPNLGFSQSGLTPVASSYSQQFLSLSCTQTQSSMVAVDEFERIYNDFDNDWKSWGGDSFSAFISAACETDLCSQFTCANKVLDPVSPQNAQLVNQKSGPVRFYGDGRTSINQFSQLSEIYALNQDFGTPMNGEIIGIVPNITAWQFVNSQSNKFTPEINDSYFRNQDSLGAYPNRRTHWYQSTFLNTHIAGSVGRSTATNGNILTLVSWLGSDKANGALNINQMTFTVNEAINPNDANAIVQGDRFVYVSQPGYQDMNFLKFIGNSQSASKVQFWATSSAAASSGTVVVNFEAPLTFAPGVGKNIAVMPQVGMQFKVIDSYVGGCLYPREYFYVAMPKMMTQVPFPSSSVMDSDTGYSIRVTYGRTSPSSGQTVVIWDRVWGSSLNQWAPITIAFPMAQIASSI